MANDDSQIIEAVLSGDREAYAELVRRYQGKILSVCNSLFNNPIDADDVAQETFLKAYSSLKTFRGQSSFGTWLTRIAINQCRDTWRKQNRRKADSLEARMEAGKDLQDPAASTSDTLENKELAQRMLSSLSDDFRTILILRESSGLSYEDLAETLGVSLDAVKSRLKRARQKLIEIHRHFSSPRNVQENEKEVV